MKEAHKPRTRPAAELAKIENAVRSMLEAIGEDTKRTGIKDTPRRVAHLYQRIFSGIGQDPAGNLKLYRVKNQEGLILVRDISFHSMCEHHLLPFFGKIHLAYLPRKNRVTGLSSLAKVVEVISRRPQLQERFANDIADTLMKALDPEGLLVVVEAEHLCMAMNDTHRSGTSAVTMAVRGAMLKGTARAEALSLISSQAYSAPGGPGHGILRKLQEKKSPRKKRAPGRRVAGNRGITGGRRVAKGRRLPRIAAKRHGTAKRRRPAKGTDSEKRNH